MLHITVTKLEWRITNGAATYSGLNPQACSSRKARLARAEEVRDEYASSDAMAVYHVNAAE